MDEDGGLFHPLQVHVPVAWDGRGHGSPQPPTLLRGLKALSITHKPGPGDSSASRKPPSNALAHRDLLPFLGALPPDTPPWTQSAHGLGPPPADAPPCHGPLGWPAGTLLSAGAPSPPGIMLLRASVLWPMKSLPMGSWSQTRKRTRASSGMCTMNTSVSSHMGLKPGGRRKGCRLAPGSGPEAPQAHTPSWRLPPPAGSLATGSNAWGPGAVPGGHGPDSEPGRGGWPSPPSLPGQAAQPVWQLRRGPGRGGTGVRWPPHRCRPPRGSAPCRSPQGAR